MSGAGSASGPGFPFPVTKEGSRERAIALTVPQQYKISILVHIVDSQLIFGYLTVL